MHSSSNSNNYNIINNPCQTTKEHEQWFLQGVRHRIIFRKWYNGKNNKKSKKKELYDNATSCSLVDYLLMQQMLCFRIYYLWILSLTSIHNQDRQDLKNIFVFTILPCFSRSSVQAFIPTHMRLVAGIDMSMYRSKKLLLQVIDDETTIIPILVDF